jgi:hypothetical protein
MSLLYFSVGSLPTIDNAFLRMLCLRRFDREGNGKPMSKPPLFFVAVIALIAVLATQRYFKQRQQEAENDRAPMRSLQVTVNDKRSFPVAKTRAPQREPLVNEPMYYEVVFSPNQGGEDITLRLKQWQYNPIEKGAQGTLNMQGTRFVSFTVQP